MWFCIFWEGGSGFSLYFPYRLPIGPLRGSLLTGGQERLELERVALRRVNSSSESGVHMGLYRFAWIYMDVESILATDC